MKNNYLYISIFLIIVSAFEIFSQNLKDAVLTKSVGEKFYYIKLIKYLHNKNYLAAVNFIDELYFYDLQSDKEPKKISLPIKNISSLSISPKCDYLCLGNSEGQLLFYKTDENLIDKVIDAHDEKINHMIFHPDSNWLYTCSDDNAIKKWNYKSYKLLDTFNYHKSDVNYLQIQNNFLLSSGDDGNIFALNLNNRKVLKKYKILDEKIISFISFLNDSLFVVSDGSTSIKLVKLGSKKNKIDTLTSHTELITKLIFINNETVATSSLDNSIIFWDLKEKKAKEKFVYHYGGILDFEKINEFLLASSSYDKTIKIFNYNYNSVEKKFGAQFNLIDFDFDKFNESVLLFSDEGFIRWLNIDNLSMIKEQKDKNKTHDIKSYKLLPGGYNLFIGVSNLNLKLIESENFKILKDIPLEETVKRKINVSKKGDIIAYESDNNTINAINITTEKKIFSIQRAHRSEISKIEFINNDKFVASSSYDATFLIINQKGEIYRKIPAHSMGITSFASFDSKNWIITVSLDGKAIIWDYENNSKKKEIFAHPGGIADVAIAKDESFFATVSLKGEIKFWKIPSWNLLSTINFNDNIIKIKITEDLKYMFCLTSEGKLYQIALVWDGIYNLMANVFPEEFADRKPTEKEKDYKLRIEKRNEIIKDKFYEYAYKKIEELIFYETLKLEVSPEYDSESEIARIFYKGNYFNFHIQPDEAEDLIKEYQNYELILEKKYRANFFERYEIPKILKRKYRKITFGELKNKKN